MLTKVPQLLLACNFDERFTSFTFFRILLIDMDSFFENVDIVADAMGEVGVGSVMLALVLSLCT